MTDEEFEDFTDKVNFLPASASKKPLAYAIVIVPDRSGTQGDDLADSLAVYGTRSAIDDERHTLVDALDLLSTSIEREHPRPPPEGASGPSSQGVSGPSSQGSN